MEHPQTSRPKNLISVVMETVVAKFGENSQIGSSCGTPTSFMPKAAAATQTVQGTTITPAFMG